MKRINLKGEKFGMLTAVRDVTEYSPKRANGFNRTRWLCVCDCGNYHDVASNNLGNSKIWHCGCLTKERKSKAMSRHGMYGTSEHVIWVAMKQRCNNKNNNAYRYYGGRGIKVCDKWNNSFESFYEDMGDKPSGMSIDRMNNNGDYTPENCRWATSEEQQNNKSNNILVNINGETKNVSQWCDSLGINYKMVMARIYRWWTHERALSASPKNRF